MGREVVGLLVGAREGVPVGCFDGVKLGWDVVGLVLGDRLGLGVGGVGEGVEHAKLSQLHAALSHGASQTLSSPSVMKGEHPGAQSNVCLKD